MVRPISWTMSRPACNPEAPEPKLCRKSVSRKTIERRLSTWLRKASAAGMLVPRCFGSKASISRIIRKIWRRPFRGGRKSSTWSVNNNKPTLSLLRAAEQARVAAISAANSRLLRRVEPKVPDADTSTARITPNSRSSRKRFTNGRPIRKVTFQSMSRTSSPGM